MTKASELAGLIGQEVGLSKWIEIDQARINAFADSTEDWQFIHVDPEAAKQTPFGGTIAHGFLTLSLMSAMSYDAVGALEGVTMGVNYGFDKLRFLAPVPVGSKIRGRFKLLSAEDKGGGGQPDGPVTPAPTLDPARKIERRPARQRRNGVGQDDENQAVAVVVMHAAPERMDVVVFIALTTGGVHGPRGATLEVAASGRDELHPQPFGDEGGLVRAVDLDGDLVLDQPADGAPRSWALVLGGQEFEAAPHL